MNIIIYNKLLKLSKFLNEESSIDLDNIILNEIDDEKIYDLIKIKFSEREARFVNDILSYKSSLAVVNYIKDLVIINQFKFTKDLLPNFLELDKNILSEIHKRMRTSIELFNWILNSDIGEEIRLVAMKKEDLVLKIFSKISSISEAQLTNLFSKMKDDCEEIADICVFLNKDASDALHAMNIDPVHINVIKKYHPASSSLNEEQIELLTKDLKKITALNIAAIRKLYLDNSSKITRLIELYIEPFAINHIKNILLSVLMSRNSDGNLPLDSNGLLDASSVDINRINAFAENIYNDFKNIEPAFFKKYSVSRVKFRHYIDILLESLKIDFLTSGSLNEFSDTAGTYNPIVHSVDKTLHKDLNIGNLANYITINLDLFFRRMRNDESIDEEYIEGIDSELNLDKINFDDKTLKEIRLFKLNTIFHEIEHYIDNGLIYLATRDMIQRLFKNKSIKMFLHRIGISNKHIKEVDNSYFRIQEGQNPISINSTYIKELANLIRSNDPKNIVFELRALSAFNDDRKKVRSITFCFNSARGVFGTKGREEVEIFPRIKNIQKNLLLNNINFKDKEVVEKLIFDNYKMSTPEKEECYESDMHHLVDNDAIQLLNIILIIYDISINKREIRESLVGAITNTFDLPI